MINRRSILQFLAGATASAIAPQKVLGEPGAERRSRPHEESDGYAFSKGKLTFTTKNSVGEEIEIFLGNVTQFDLYTEIETLSHRSSSEGSTILNAEVEISRRLTFSGTAESDPSGNMMKVTDRL